MRLLAESPYTADLVCDWPSTGQSLVNMLTGKECLACTSTGATTSLQK